MVLRLAWLVVLGCCFWSARGTTTAGPTSASSPASTSTSSSTSTTVSSTTPSTVLSPHSIPGKPSKFDEFIDDKVYIDVGKNYTDLEQPPALTLEASLQDVKKRKRRSYRIRYPATPGPMHRRLVRFPPRPWSPYDSYGPRSPRLVFRDPVEPSTLQAPWNHNSLQDVTGPEDNRGECREGSCQSVLTCWLSWGRVASSCTGFLQVCCDYSTGKTSTGGDPAEPTPNEVPQNYGPVVNDPRCGVSAKQGAQRRIVGGDEAGFGSFPWQAYIRIGSSRCGGSLVNRYHVVTAGHCVARANARQVQVTLGDYVINSAIEPLPAYTYGVRQISVHPNFKFTPQADRFDVAVLRLDRPVQYMAHIAPICLPSKGDDFLGQFGWAAGWGALQPGSRLRPKTLQAVDVPVIDNRLCERWHRSNGINVIIYDEMMCAGYRGGGKDSCQGDSGGPLMLERTGRWYLIGIVSAGYSCAQRGQPGIYHRVAHTVDWISHIINSY